MAAARNFWTFGVTKFLEQQFQREDEGESRKGEREE